MEGTILFEIALNFLVRNYFTTMQKCYGIQECGSDVDYVLIIPTHSCESVRQFFHAAAVKVTLLVCILLRMFLNSVPSEHTLKKNFKVHYEATFFFTIETLNRARWS